MGIIREKYYQLIRSFLENFSVILLIILLLYALSPLFFHSEVKFYRVYDDIAWIFIGILSLVIIVYFPVKLYIKHFYNKILLLSRKKLSGEHLAIIIVKYDSFYKSLYYVLMHFNKLFNTLDANKVPFVVYLINNEKEFVKVVQDKDVKAMYIFSHGQKHAIRFGKKMFHYCNIPKVSHIKFVGQFHCNRYGGMPLKEHLDCEGLVTDDWTIYQEINDFIDSGKYLVKLKKLFSIKK